MQAPHLPTDRTYTDKHMWLALAPGDRVCDFPLRVGLTPVAMGDQELTALQLPPVRTHVDPRVPCGMAHRGSQPAYPIYPPIPGLITIHNADVIAQPRLVTEDPFHTGWLFAILPARGSLPALLPPIRYLAAISTVA